MNSLMSAAFVDELVKISGVTTELQPHQQRVVDRILRPDQPGLLVAHGLGSGKTLTSIAAQDALGMGANVVLPAALQANYEKERTKHLASGTAQPIDISSLQALARKGGLPTDHPMTIVDEAHRAREVGSSTFQNLRDSLSGTQKRMLLTASPFYNRPSDIAPLINMAAGENVLPNDPSEFKRRYIAEKAVQPTMWGSLVHGAKPGVEEIVNPKREGELRSTFGKWVDYHPGSTQGFPTVERSDVNVPMTPEQLTVYDAMMGKAPAWAQYKVKQGLPPSKQESKDLNAFINAVRQVSNTTRGFAPDQAPQEPKIEKAFQNLQSTLKDNPEARAVVYSNYLEGGLDPYKERLQAAGVPYGMFTGSQPKAERDAMVNDYNAGKLRALLLSSAGGEGLDLKGTRLIQVLDPHWNNEKLRQVEGRGIRYGSHADLPEDQRNVRVENYLATRPERTGLSRMLLGKDTGGSADQYLRTMSGKKDALIDKMKALLPNQPPAK
jgi:superfamily II DNA or RNA helicase